MVKVLNTISNPHGQARAPRARQWRKRGEGLKFRCTAKGKKEGCTNVNFMVAIAYGKGVVLCEQWEGTITGEKFASIVKRCLRKAFRNSANPKGKLFLMDIWVPTPKLQSGDACYRESRRKGFQNTCAKSRSQPNRELF